MNELQYYLDWLASIDENDKFAVSKRNAILRIIKSIREQMEENK